MFEKQQMHLNSLESIFCCIGFMSAVKQQATNLKIRKNRQTTICREENWSYVNFKGRFILTWSETMTDLEKICINSQSVWYMLIVDECCGSIEKHLVRCLAAKAQVSVSASYICVWVFRVQVIEADKTDNRAWLQEGLENKASFTEN